MKEELYKKFNECKNNDSSEIDDKIIKTKTELKSFNQNVDNILFCWLQKEVIKSNDLLDKTHLSNSQKILSLKSLTMLNIIPEKGPISNSKNYLYYLLSNNKVKKIYKTLTPFEFWKNLLKFQDAENNFCE